MGRPVTAQQAMLRRLAATAAGCVIVVSLLRGMAPWRSLPSRASILRAHAARDLASRRLAGSAGAPDPRYLAFLEGVRQRIPAAANGIAVYVPRASNWHVYLAEYHLAPVPVLVSPASLPSGWSAAVYGDWRQPQWRLLSEVPGGALVDPVR